MKLTDDRSIDPLNSRNRLRLRTGREGAEDDNNNAVGSKSNRSVSVTERENRVLRISTRMTDKVARLIKVFQRFICHC